MVVVLCLGFALPLVAAVLHRGLGAQGALWSTMDVVLCLGFALPPVSALLQQGIGRERLDMRTGNLKLTWERVRAATWKADANINHKGILEGRRKKKQKANESRKYNRFSVQGPT
jgi:uncharacterized membrane protein YqaE (UPF0057 family)